MTIARLAAAVVASTLLLTCGRAAAQDVATPAAAFHGFLSDVAHDYVHFLSLENLQITTAGLTAAAAIHPADQKLAEETASVTPYATKPGATYGNLAFQFPLAITWWIAGHATGSGRGADAGRDLVRAQISAASWTYLLKYAVDRTRPNGDPRSFPSGHASASFATATVLQEHYGWKLGVPFYLAATYVAGERVTNNKHWASDVVFGATVGILSARTVTLHVRGARLAVAPQAVAGGGGVLINVLH